MWWLWGKRYDAAAPHIQPYKCGCHKRQCNPTASIPGQILFSPSPVSCALIRHSPSSSLPLSTAYNNGGAYPSKRAFSFVNNDLLVAFNNTLQCVLQEEQSVHDLLFSRYNDMSFYAGVFVSSVFVGAFAFGVGFDIGINSLWDRVNKGVSHAG